MRVMIVTGSLPPMKCGVGDYTKHLADSLAKYSGVDVGVLTDWRVLTRNENPDVFKYTFDLFPKIRGGLNDIYPVIKLVKSWKPDLVHFQFPTMGYKDWGIFQLLIPAIIWLMRFPIVMTWHEPYRVTKIKWISYFSTKYLMFLFRGLIVVRSNYLELMPEWFKNAITKKKYICISNASTIPVRKFDNAISEKTKRNLGVTNKNLIIFFGFAFENKNVELLFDICDPGQDHITLICDLHESFPYHQKIIRLMQSEMWRNSCNFTGYLPANDVADILVSADAVVLPFSCGGGDWNTSIHAVNDQGAFLLTTSLEQEGYLKATNTYYAKPGDVGEMKLALRNYVGIKQQKPNIHDRWKSIAVAHFSFYETVLKGCD